MLDLAHNIHKRFQVLPASRLSALFQLLRDIAGIKLFVVPLEVFPQTVKFFLHALLQGIQLLAKLLGSDRGVSRIAFFENLLANNLAARKWSLFLVGRIFLDI